MEIDVFPLLFNSKPKKRIEGEETRDGEREREEKRERKSGARSPQSAGFLPAEPARRALFRSRRGLGAFKGF